MEGLMGGEGREEQLLVGNGRGMKVVVEKERGGRTNCWLGMEGG